jgi:hypothetical protein
MQTSRSLSLHAYIHQKYHVWWDHKELSVRPLYIAFRVSGVLDSICQVSRVQHAVPIIDVVPEMQNIKKPWPKLPATIWHFGPPVPLAKPLRTGAGMYNRRVRCDLDLLLACETSRRWRSGWGSGGINEKNRIRRIDGGESQSPSEANLRSNPVRDLSMPRRSTRPTEVPHAPAPSTHAGQQAQIEDLKRHLNEIRLMLAEVLRRLSSLQSASGNGPIPLEGRIPLKEAVGLVWGRSATKNPESIRNHADILKLFAAQGINGVFLETAVQGNDWFTSREAVERFMDATFRRQR